MQASIRLTYTYEQNKKSAFCRLFLNYALNGRVSVITNSW